MPVVSDIGLEQHGSLAITDDLCNTLFQLQRNRSNKLLWVDAICIDQNDISERGHQVGLMRNIYTQASRVVISLYPFFNGKMQLALNTLQLFGQDVDYDSSGRQPTVIRTSGRIRRSIDFGSQWPNIESLLYLPWFEGLWIWQEVFSARSALIARSGVFLEWNTFCTAIAGLNTLRWRGEEELWSAKGLRDRVIRIFRLVESSRYKEESTLTDLLFRTDYCSCSDEKGRIFALLGMIPAAVSAK